MGYREDQPTAEARVGQAIYMNALEDRRGFRPDQLGISTADSVWTEIFEAIGHAARDASFQHFLQSLDDD